MQKCAHLVDLETMLPNAYFLANFRFDTTENEPAKNLQILQKIANFHQFSMNFANFANPNPLSFLGKPGRWPRCCRAGRAAGRSARRGTPASEAGRPPFSGFGGAAARTKEANEYNELKFPPNFERLVHGCIDTDLFK